MRRFLLLCLLVFSLCQSGFSHSVQVAWCQSCDGLLRLYVEHWHNAQDPSTTDMTISVTVNGTTTTETGSPLDNLQDLDIDELPGCATPATSFAGCTQGAGCGMNQCRDWVVYEFPDVPKGSPVEITVISGNSVFTEDCDGTMYPASTGTFTLDPDLQPGLFTIPTQTLCQGDTFDIQPHTDSLDETNGAFKWLNDNSSIGLTDSGTGYIPPFVAVGAETQQIANLTFLAGCFTATSQIIVNPNPRASFQSGNFDPNNGGDPISGRKCLYDSIVFNNNTTTSGGSITNYTWDFGNGLPPLSNVSNPKVKYNAAGTYNVELAVENNFGCRDTLIAPVEVYPIPTAVIRTAPECLNRALQFRDSSYVAAPDFISQFRTDFGDGSPVDNLINPSHVYGAAGNYSVDYEVVTNHGCRDSTEVEAVVFEIPNADFLFTEVCENDGVTEFSDNSSIATGSLISWNWNFDDNINTISSLQNPDHNYRREGVYDVQLVIQSDNGCTDSITKPVTVLAKPSTIFLSNITEDCGEACIDFYDFTLPNANTITNWIWDLGDGTTSTAQAPTHCYVNESNTTDDSYDVSLITFNDLGCSDTVSVPNYINVWHNPVSSFAVDPTRTNMHSPWISTNNFSTGANFYSWDFGYGFFSTDFNPDYTYPEDSARYLIQLAVETDKGCVDTSDYLLIVDPVVTIFVPNTFTPDGDGNNDEFMFVEFGVVEELLEFIVLDRWGNVVHRTDTFKAWDGMHKGVPAVQDTYAWRIEYLDALGQKGQLSGHVNLLR